MNTQQSKRGSRCSAKHMAPDPILAGQPSAKPCGRSLIAADGPCSERAPNVHTFGGSGLLRPHNWRWRRCRGLRLRCCGSDQVGVLRS